MIIENNDKQSFAKSSSKTILLTVFAVISAFILFNIV